MIARLFLATVFALGLFGVIGKVFKDRDMSMRDGFLVFVLLGGSAALEFTTVDRYNASVNTLAMIMTFSGFAILAKNIGQKFKARTSELRKRR